MQTLMGKSCIALVALLLLAHCSSSFEDTPLPVNKVTETVDRERLERNKIFDCEGGEYLAYDALKNELYGAVEPMSSEVKGFRSGLSSRTFRLVIEKRSGIEACMIQHNLTLSQPISWTHLADPRTSTRITIRRSLDPTFVHEFMMFDYAELEDGEEDFSGVFVVQNCKARSGFDALLGDPDITKARLADECAVPVASTPPLSQ